MESQIAKLLKGGERGKIDRRELLQALGVGATAAFAVGVLPKSALALAAQAAASARTFPVTHVNHPSYAVADYAKSRDFYIELFGMRDAWDDGKGCGLEFGDLTLPNGIYVRPVAKPGEKANVGHIAYGIQNFMAQKAAMKAEMDRRGANPRADGYAGWSLTDAAGYMIQITPVKDKAMYPGASPLCPEPSAKCLEGYEAGLKHVGAAAKPSGRGFKAYAFSHIALHVPDIPKEMEFYKNMMGMKVISDKPEECVLRFGQNTLNLRKATRPDNKPYVESFGFLIENYDHTKVKAELDRRGLNPKPASKLAWSINDPDGFPIEVAGQG